MTAEISASDYAIWGWGSTPPRQADLEALAPLLAASLGFSSEPIGAPRPTAAPPAPRVALPARLQQQTSEPAGSDRLRHALGRSTLDVLRGISGCLPSVPDHVLHPRTEEEIADILDFAGREGVAVVPFGGGTSVVGGVTPAAGRPSLTVSLDRISGVRSRDDLSRSVCVAAGTRGPELEAALRPHGLTARFFPQSFERSTVGGWVATRAAGHFATRWQHIDDLVESVRAVTGAGVWESRRLPASGAGPSPDRWLLGSEGTLGVITSVWLRIQPRPAVRASTTLRADTFSEGIAAARAVVQSGLTPATCRLIDEREAVLAGAGGGGALLLLGSEGGQWAHAELSAAVATAVAAGARESEQATDSQAGAWRSSFLRAPLLREQLLLLGVFVETFETAVTWERLDALLASVTHAATSALTARFGTGRVTCRITHMYPDGAAPYFTLMAPLPRRAAGASGSDEQWLDGIAQAWADVQAACLDAVLAAGGSVTHHHAVGREHMAHYTQQRPEPFARAFEAVKTALDPAHILNPGVLIS